MRSVVVHTHETNSFRAGEVAGEAIFKALAESPPQLLILFSSVGHDLQALVAGLRTKCSGSTLVGCSGAGVISTTGCDENTHSAVIMAIASSTMECSPFLIENLSVDPVEAGRRLGRHVAGRAREECRSKLLLLFADGLTINADALYRGLAECLSSHIDVVGGTAGNDFQHGKTYQLADDKLVTDGLCGVLLQGEFRYHVGVTHGSRPVGLSRTITRARGATIYEIDGQPALDILKEFIGPERLKDMGQTLNLFELGQEFPGEGYCDNILNRAIVGIDEESGGIRLPVEIPLGSKVRITRRDMQLVLERSRAMAERVVDEVSDHQHVAYLYFNCSGRGSYLFGKPEPDVQAVRRALGEDSNFAGFFTFGEFAPIAGRNYFHNYTGVLLALEP